MHDVERGGIVQALAIDAAPKFDGAAVILGLNLHSFEKRARAGIASRDPDDFLQ